jgi:hypothetical protein
MIDTAASRGSRMMCTSVAEMVLLKAFVWEIVLKVRTPLTIFGVRSLL